MTELTPEPQRQYFDKPLELACGEKLERFELVYETYGTLNANRSNAVLICHGLSGNHHVAGRYSGDKQAGWWNEYVGPGKAIDTDRFFVVGVNNLGGCSGSTGPNTRREENGPFWGKDFPPLRVRDWVAAQQRLMLSLDIPCWAAVVGCSLGGMQALRWAIDFPEQLRHAVIVAAALRLNSQNLAFNGIARQAIFSDPKFRAGNYLNEDTFPEHGLALARMLAHVTYLSGARMNDKFGRELRQGNFDLGKKEKIVFQVESYLEHHGSKFARHFDANSYLLMLKALDFFDPARDYDDDAARALVAARCGFLVVSFSSDWRFPPKRSREIVKVLLEARKAVSYVEIDAPHGHDSFLLPNPRFHDTLNAYLRRVDEEAKLDG